MKRVHALFLLHAEAPAGITARAQILLHRFTNTNILDLDLVAELYRSLGCGTAMAFSGKYHSKMASERSGPSGNTMFSEMLSG